MTELLVLLNFRYRKILAMTGPIINTVSTVKDLYIFIVYKLVVLGVLTTVVKLLLGPLL